MFDLYRQSGIQPLTILSYASAWSNGVAPARDEEADRFAVLAEATVRRYRHVRAWEVWNEPNIPTFWQPKPDARDYAC